MGESWVLRRFAPACLTVAVLVAVTGAVVSGQDTSPTPETATVEYELDDVNPADFLRFDGDREAAERRSVLVSAIWPDGMPATIATIDATLPDVRAGWAIVHLGHSQHIASGELDYVADALTEAGYSVVQLEMPHDDHDTIMATDGTAGLQRFLDPVVETVNAFESIDPDAPILMTGISGGGWTTHLAAAVDTRIDVSVPVAGSLPLFARPFSFGSGGDAEQFWPAVFGEADTDGDGVPDTATGFASWIEVYALAVTEGRRQTQVLNEFDSCCFSGDAHESYRGWLTDAAPGWSVVVDDSHQDHIISPSVVLSLLS